MQSSPRDAKKCLTLVMMLVKLVQMHRFYAPNSASTDVSCMVHEDLLVPDVWI